MCTITDVDANGNIIDRYSNIMNYGCNDLGGGSNTNEGVEWNREHVFPSSWFNGSTGTPPFSDLHNLFPSDAFVNQEKSNLPLGEVTINNVGALSISQVGPDANNCTNSCNGAASGEVFEPANQYKGDFARVHLYMAVKYENNAASWENDNPCGDSAMSGDSYKFYNTCYLNMLLRWHLQDPPDQLEIDRNNAIFGIQGNRNPFVDRPEYAAQIWGNNCCPNCDPFFIEASPSCSGVNSTFNIDYSISGFAVGNFTIIESTSMTNLSNQGITGSLTGFNYSNTNQNDKLTLSFIDELTGCIVEYDVLQLDCSLPTSTCDCSLANPLNITVQASGNGNGFSMVYILVDLSGNVIAVNQTGNFPSLAGNTNFDVYAVNIDDLDVTNFINNIQGNTISIILDPDNPLNDYCYTVAGPAPFICECTCDDILVEATTECNADSTYTISVNSIMGGSGSTNFDVSIAGTTLPFSGTPIQFAGLSYIGNADGSQQAIPILVTDQTDSSCSIVYNIFELNCLEQEVCVCTDPDNPTLTINVQGLGNANDFAMYYILIDNAGNIIASNSSGTFPGLMANGTMYNVYAVNYDVNDAPNIVNDIQAANTVTDIINASGAFMDYCYVISPAAPFDEVCTCPICDITPVSSTSICNDNGTPDDPADDTYTFNVTVNGNSTFPGASNTFNDDQGNSGIANGATVSYGPYPISGGNTIVNYEDVGEPSCIASIEAIAPLPCSNQLPCSDIIVDEMEASM